MSDVDHMVDDTVAVVRRLRHPVGGFVARLGGLRLRRGMAGWSKGW
jgi:hypothetical protein